MQIITQTALALIGLPLLIFTAGTQDAEPFKGPDDALPTVPSLVRDALLEGRTEDALDTLDQLAELHPESQDFWTLLRISALTEGKDLAQAVKVAETFEQDHAQSPWLAKVRFRRAENLRQLRRFEEAEQIYEASAQALRSPERQGRLAQVYLVHAVRMAADRKPNEPDQGEQDLKGARELFGRVLGLDAPIAAVEHALFERAVCSEKLGAHAQAVQDWQIYLTRNGTNRHQEARLRKGLAQLAHDRAGDALRTLEDLVQDTLQEKGNSQGIKENAAIRILSRARFAIAQAWAKRGMRDLARAAYGRFLEAHPEDVQAAQAAFNIATLHREQKHVEDARDAYEAFRKRPRLAADQGASALQAEKNLHQEALFLEANMRGALDDHDGARELYSEYTRRYPSGPRWSEAQRGIVNSVWAKGASAANKKDYTTARSTWGEFLEGWPLDPRVADVHLALANLFDTEAREAKSAGTDFKPSLLKAIEAWGAIARRHPDTNQASQALFQLADAFEFRLDDMRAAVEGYRACTYGSHAGRAQARLAAMISPRLRLETERTWRSNETARVKVHTRNLEELEVHVHPLDLEAYFRKHLSHQRIEDLDLDLIAPDDSFQLKVTDYAEFSPLTQEIEIQVEGPGVWAVVVQSGDQRAATLLIRSDIEVLVKSSRREAFVFAQDMLTDEGAPGVKILLALPGQGEGGAALLRELETGADGTARVALEELQDSDELQMFAAREGHVASDGLSLQGLKISRGLAQRAVVFTDRAGYRQDETVHWRSIVRDVRGGSYMFNEGEEVRVEMIDPAGRRMRRADLPLGPFGTIEGTFPLPLQAQLGNWTLRVTTRSGASYQCRFAVNRFELRKVELLVKADHSVVYRGDEVTLTANANWYYGQPVIGREVVFRLPDGREQREQTDSEGQAQLTYSTRDHANEGQLTFSASMPSEGVDARNSVFLAIRAFGLNLDVPEHIRLAGEPVSIGVRAIDPAGEPVVTELHLLALWQAPKGSPKWNPAEETVSEITLTTDKDGRGRWVLNPKQGGTYTIRALATDRFGNPISDEEQFYLSGDDDPLRLRILTDQTKFNQGETVTLDVINRTATNLALVTFEGETILEHRLVRLTEERSGLSFETNAGHFPNMRVAICMMEQGELHQAHVDLNIERQLNITLSPTQEVVAPGDEAVVEILVTDQLGNPAQAEISLAVVDAALLQLYPDRTPNLLTAFHSAAKRNAGLKTTSSCAFKYEGRTQTIAEAILREETRKIAQGKWQEDQGLLLDSLDALGYVGGLEMGSPTQTLDDKRDRRRTSAGRTAPSEEFLEAEFDAAGFNDVIGIGGGAGGAYGGRFGGRRSLKAGGGNARSPEAVLDGDTLFWSPSVISDGDGTAQVRFRMPLRSTRWMLIARGVTPGTLLGGAKAEITSRAEFQLELLFPSELMAGDEPSPSVRIHDLVGLGDECRLTLTVETAEGRFSRTRSVTLPNKASVTEVDFGLFDALPEGALSLTVSADLVNTDGDPRTISENVIVRPYGLAFTDSEGGVLEENTTTFLELPGARKYRARTLQLELGAGIDRMLIEEALARGPIWRCAVYQDVGSPGYLASELLGVARVLHALEQTGSAGATDLSELRGRAASLVGTLTSAQQEDGGWRAAGRRDQDPVQSARCLWALAEARRAGIEISDQTLDLGVKFATNAHRRASQQSRETKALLQHALAAAGKADFAALNRLYRERARLSPAALVYTSLALSAHGSQPMAAEVCDLIAAQMVTSDGNRASWSVAGNSPDNLNKLEQTALAVLALKAAQPASESIEAGNQWMLSQRPFGRARGLVLGCLLDKDRSALNVGETMRVKVRVAGLSEQIVELRGGDPAQVLVMDLGAVSDRRVGIELTVEGRGKPHWAAVLEGFTPDLSPTIPDDRGLHISDQRIVPSDPRLNGKVLPTGFSILRNYEEQWINEVGQLARGQSAHVEILWWRDSQRSKDGHLVMRVPTPAGAEVIAASVKGGIGQARIRPGAVLVSVDPRALSGRVEFEFRALVAGNYKLLPPTLRSENNPGAMVVGQARNFGIRTDLADVKNEFRATPDELYHRGLRLFDGGEAGHAAAHASLTALYDEFEPWLLERPLVETAHRLLQLAVKRAEPETIVEYFEAIKEKDSTITIPFEEVVVIGEAYRSLQEYERAMLIFRATLAETFGRDTKVAGALEELGEFASAMELLQELWLAYPDFSAVKTAHLTLADKLLAKAATAHTDKSLVRRDWRRGGLVLAGSRHLDRFLALHPSDPQAADAALALVSARLSVEDYLGTVDLSGTFASLFTSPRHADAFIYSQAVANWWLGNEEEALQALDKVATAEYEEDGRLQPSENRDLALYILGQIHHARRELTKASEYYERVEELFADAHEALADFREKTIAMDEVTTVQPGESVQVELRHKGLEEVEMLVYKVDLLTLYLREKNLSEITQVNLSGISPTLQTEISLEESEDRRESKDMITMELTEPGAYLVIARGGELFASGLVLVSNLDLEITEESGSSRVRVQALDAANGTYVRGVDVRVIGSSNQRFTRGLTDPRGLFVADGVMGSATVVAKLGKDHYAFHRGAVALGEEPVIQDSEVPQRPASAGSYLYFQNVREFNDGQNRGRDQAWTTELGKSRNGVQIQQVK
jgi:hypothetical protein